MEKKIYQTPQTEQLYFETTSHLLDWSAPMPGGDGNTGGGIIDMEAKRHIFDDEDFFDDEEEIETCISFNVWE